jgi:2-methylcitrate dehydratase PrpD
MTREEKVLIDVFVRHILDTTYEDLSEEDVAWSKKVVLDYFCAVLAGHSIDECKTVKDEVGGWTQGGNFGIHFLDKKTIQPFAALINGTLARAADLDDVYEDGFLQVYGHILPPLFVGAESMKSCTGKQFITALNVGADINCRLAMANNEPCTVSGRYNLFKIFGAVAAVAKLLDFNEEQVRNALGISFGTASGELQGLREGAFSCLLASGGFSAINTIFSILFSKRNIHGTRDIFDGQYGFLSAFEADVDRKALVENIGAEYYGKKSSIKLYPSSRATHAGIDASIGILNENRIDISNIAKVDIEMFDFCYNIVGSPIEDKQNPKSSEQAKFSYPFCVACALSGTPMLKLLDEKTIQNEKIRELCKKVSTRVDKNLKKFQARVNVVLASGEVFQKEIYKCKGHPENPLGFNDIQKKFLETADYAKEKNFKIEPSVSDFLFEYIEKLEDRVDVQQINQHLR